MTDPGKEYTYEWDTDIDKTAEAVLIAHQRRNSRSCLCGWSELGKSHAAHQLVMLREAGILLRRAYRTPS